MTGWMTSWTTATGATTGARAIPPQHWAKAAEANTVANTAVHTPRIVRWNDMILLTPLQLPPSGDATFTGTRPAALTSPRRSSVRPDRAGWTGRARTGED